jgi:hypothetical protein
MNTKIKQRILVVRCKTPGCEVDLDYKNAVATGIGALAPFSPTEPFRVFMKGIEADPGLQTCPECFQTHEYTNEDIEEKAIPEPEVGDTVFALGESGRFELMSLTNGRARIKLLGLGPDGPVNLRYEVDVPYSVLTVYKKKRRER